MYKRFKLDLQGKSNQEFIKDLMISTHSQNFQEIGNEEFKKQQDMIKSNLESYSYLEVFKNEKGQLSGNKIIKQWFPDIEADIFLSHSHQDKDLVICLAGWLYKEFGLTSFIDSTVWGYANDLLRIIDNEYSLYPNSNTSYSYNKRNYSTSHVHMMLSTSLMSMIDRCECIIFVNTSQSFTPADDMNNGSTISPWIFSEILMAKMLRIQIPSRLESTPIVESIQLSLESRERELLEVGYDINTKHLTPLSISQLLEWQSKKVNEKEENLDILYELTCNER